MLIVVFNLFVRYLWSQNNVNNDAVYSDNVNTFPVDNH